ncbi:hypothetical protein IM538_03925 [Cytobacillus suaedae]|nr:hypothetical protein IM538_03925 [Cytobacillus suaedae]
MSSRMINYTVVILLVTSISFNYYLYKEKEGYLMQLGADNQRTVRGILNELSEGNTDHMIKTLKEANGDVLLERHIGELRQLSREFHRMSSEMSTIGLLIDDIIKQYYKLKVGVKDGENIEGYKREIEENIQFLESVLSQIDSEFGDNSKVWYQELSGYQTETQKDVWEKFNAFNTQKQH